MEEGYIENFKQEIDGEGLSPCELSGTWFVGHFGGCDCIVREEEKGEAGRSFINEDTIYKGREDETMGRGDGGG